MSSIQQALDGDVKCDFLKENANQIIAAVYSDDPFGQSQEFVDHVLSGDCDDCFDIFHGLCEALYAFAHGEF